MKEEIDEIDFLYVDKHQTSVQVDTVNFGGHSHLCPEYEKEKVRKHFAILQQNQFCWLTCIREVISFIFQSNAIRNKYFHVKDECRNNLSLFYTLELTFMLLCVFSTNKPIHFCVRVWNIWKQFLGVGFKKGNF